MASSKFFGVLPLAFACATVFAQAGQTVRVAFIDPLSGSFANVGQNQLKSWQFSAEQFDQGILYVVQGNSSGAAAAISDAVTKHNERNPGKDQNYAHGQQVADLHPLGQVKDFAPFVAGTPTSCQMKRPS